MQVFLQHNIRVHEHLVAATPPRMRNGDFVTRRVTNIAGLLACVTSLICSTTGLSGAQQQAPSTADIYGLMEVVWDMPAGYEAWPKKGRTPGEVTRLGESNHAYGTRELPKTEPGSEPVRQDAGDVRIWITGSPGQAIETITPGNERFHFNLTPMEGSCTGKKIGDICVHSIMGGSHPGAAALWFTSGNIAYYVDLRGPAKDHNWPTTIEKLATTLLVRAGAVRLLLAARTEPLAVRGRKLTGRNIGGVQVTHIRDYADTIGGRTTLDVAKGTAEVKSARHVLLLHIGTRSGTLDGKPISLAFPALRDGAENVYCPLAALKLLD